MVPTEIKLRTVVCLFLHLFISLFKLRLLESLYSHLKTQELKILPFYDFFSCLMYKVKMIWLIRKASLGIVHALGKC